MNSFNLNIRTFYHQIFYNTKQVEKMQIKQLIGEKFEEPMKTKKTKKSKKIDVEREEIM